MKKALRWIFYVGATLIALYGLLVLHDHVMEPTFAEENTREFLKERSLAIEQFSGPEFQKVPGLSNSYIWTRQDGDQVLRVDTSGSGDLICLYYLSSLTGEISRSICQDSTKSETLVVDCHIIQTRPHLVEHCKPARILSEQN